MRTFRKIGLLGLLAAFAAAPALMTNCGDGGGTAHTLAAPALADVVTALKLNTTYGMVPGLAISSITLPACTQSTSFTVNYTLTGASWLSLDSSTRILSLANGATVIPTDANTATTVTYICTDASSSSVTASIQFTVNDADGGGVIDAKEYTYGAVPLLRLDGFFQLTPANLDEYRVGTSTFKIPTAITKATSGMSATDAADDTADFDGDKDAGGGTNLAEIMTAGTNPMVYTSAEALTLQGTVYATGNDPKQVVAANFNSAVDDYLDLVVANLADDTVSLFLGVGDGTFGTPVSFETEDGPLGITAADLNGDGYMDLAMAGNDDGFGNQLRVLIGDGNGSFTEPAPGYGAGNTPYLITSADFDGDGDVDVAISNNTANTVSVLMNNGDGTFADKVSYSVGAGSNGIVSADVDNDGDIDLAVANHNSDTLTILLNNGDGTGTFTASGENPVTDTGPFDIVAADFNGDGYIDLANINDNALGGSTVTVFLNDGDGTFGLKTSSSVGTNPQGIQASDLDGDGDIDLVVSNFNDGNIIVLLNDGAGVFTPQTAVTVGAGSSFCATGDFNNDGKIDLAVVMHNYVPPSIGILLNQ